MFKNFIKNSAVQIKLVNTDKQQIENPNIIDITPNPEEIAKITTDAVVKTVIVVGLVFAATIVLKAVCDTASEVTINKLS